MVDGDPATPEVAAQSTEWCSTAQLQEARHNGDSDERRFRDRDSNRCRGVTAIWTGGKALHVVAEESGSWPFCLWFNMEDILN